MTSIAKKNLKNQTSSTGQSSNDDGRHSPRESSTESFPANDGSRERLDGGLSSTARSGVGCRGGSGEVRSDGVGRSGDAVEGRGDVEDCSRTGGVEVDEHEAEDRNKNEDQLGRKKRGKRDTHFGYRP